MGMQPSPPEPQHQWLLKMVGPWNFEMVAQGPPDQPPHKSTGVEVVRAIGDLWIIGESTGQSPEGDSFIGVTTIGYDPQRQRFVGTWIGSMMNLLWIYDGELDPAGKKLSLHSTGPSFTDPEKKANYIDAMEQVSSDHRIMTSSVQGEDGSWNTFMTGHFHRIK